MRKRIVAVLIIVSLGVVVLPVSPAVATNVYEIQGVAVDVTADTAAAARKKALTDGEAAAFRRLLERITLLEDRHRLPSLKTSEISTFVQDFSVADEKTSSVRYLATLSYRFKRRDVREMLISYNISFAETPSKLSSVAKGPSSSGNVME